MILKNVAGQGVYFYEYTISTSAPKTGDSANITGYYSLDGGASSVFATAHPTEISSSHMPGVYWQPLAQGETNGNMVSYAWTSSTGGIAIIPVMWSTTGTNFPASAYGAANGLPTLDGSAHLIVYSVSQPVVASAVTGDVQGTIETQPTWAATTDQLVTAILAGSVPPSGNTPNSIADCLNAARAQAIGAWDYSTKGTGIVKASDGSILKTFVITYDANGFPNTRT